MTRVEEVRTVESLTKEDLLKTYMSSLWPRSDQRSRLAIHVQGKQCLSDLPFPQLPRTSLINDPEAFRASCYQFDSGM